MKIRAETRFTNVVIVGFVSRGPETYAVVIREDGSLCEYPISELTVIDNC